MHERNILATIEIEMATAGFEKDSEHMYALEVRRQMMQRRSIRGAQPNRAQIWDGERDELDRPVGRTALSCGHGGPYLRRDAEGNPLEVNRDGVDHSGHKHRHFGRDTYGRLLAHDADVRLSHCGDPECRGNGGLKVNRRIGEVD